MKHFFALLLASVGLMLTPSAAFTQDTLGAPAKADAQSSPVPAKPDAQSSPAPAKADAQSSPAPAAPAAASPAQGQINPTVINLPPPPFQEYFLNAAFTSTHSGGSSGQTSGLQVSPFASFIPAAAQIAAKPGVDGRFALEFGVAHGFKKVQDFTLVAEFPVVFNPNGDVKSGNLSLARSYSSLFFTPALRIMYAQDRVKHPGYPPVYPWISLGGGLAHFSPSSISLSGGASGAKSSTEGALQAGAGVDIGIYRKSIALRAEVRDFYTGPPNLGAAGINLRHNVVASAGIVFRCCWRSSDQKSPTTSAAHN